MAHCEAYPGDGDNVAVWTPAGDSAELARHGGLGALLLLHRLYLASLLRHAWWGGLLTWRCCLHHLDLQQRLNNQVNHRGPG